MCWVAQSRPTLWPHGLQPTRLLRSWNFPGKNNCSGLLFSTSGNLPDPGIELASPTLAGGFFTTEPLGKTNQYSSLTIRNLFLSLPLVEDFACLEGAGIRKNLICKEKALGLFFFFSFIFISWRLTTSQYCSGFCHTLTWISHGFTCIPHPDPPSQSSWSYTTSRKGPLGRWETEEV